MNIKHSESFRSSDIHDPIRGFAVIDQRQSNTNITETHNNNLTHTKNKCYRQFLKVIYCILLLLMFIEFFIYGPEVIENQIKNVLMTIVQMFIYTIILDLVLASSTLIVCFMLTKLVFKQFVKYFSPFESSQNNSSDYFPMDESLLSRIVRCFMAFPLFFLLFLSWFTYWVSDEYF